MHKPWLYRKRSLKERLEEALLKCRITSCNFETVNPTELCFHYEVHSAISRIKDTDLEHQIIEFLPDGRHHPVFNDRSDVFILLPCQEIHHPNIFLNSLRTHIKFNFID